MADLNRTGDMEVKIVGVDGIIPVDVVVDEDTENALKIKGNVFIAGSSGAAQFLSIANRMESEIVDPSASGDNVVLNLTVPVGKTWYLKGLVVGTSRTATFRMTVAGTTKLRGNLDASYSFEIQLHGFMVAESTVIQVILNTSANQALSGNLVILEETNP